MHAKTTLRASVRTRLTAGLGLTLLPLAAGLAGLATTDLALQTRANPPTMGALEVSSGSMAPASPPPASAPAAGTVYVSDLPFTVIANGWGPAERDRSNGEQAAGDGRPITLNGVTYDKGLGVHAYSEVQINMNGGYSRFIADIGLDDETGTNGSVQFEVRGDGAVLYESAVLYSSTATQAVDLDVAGLQQLVLIVKDGGDGSGNDHADWAGARLKTGPAAPTGLAVVRRSAA